MSTSDAELILLAILTVTSYSLVGLLAIWAGLGRPHWFLRVAVVGGVLLLLLLIPAYEPLLLFSIQSAVVILPLMLLRGFRAPIPAGGPDAKSQTGAIAWRLPQFSVSDLLLLTVVVAVIVAVAIRVPSDIWTFWYFLRSTVDPWYPFAGTPMTPATGWTALGSCCLGLGISSLVALWVALGRRRLWLRLIVLCVVPTSAVMAVWLALARASGWLRRGTRRMASSSAPSPTVATLRPGIRHSAKVAAVLLSLLILLPPLATFCVLVVPPPKPPQIVLPDHNGYDDLLKAANVLDTGVLPDGAEFSQEALQIARSGLARESVVPLDYSTSDTDLGRITAFRELARAFFAEGQVAEMDGRPADALRSYLDLFRLGQAATRGGLPVHWLVGRAIEDMSMDALIGLRKTLTPQQCRELIHTLQKVDANREPLEDVLDREQLWERITYDWKNQLTRRLSIASGCYSESGPLLEERLYRHEAKLRLLICGLALRSYCVEKGQPPEKLADLVPDHLTAVPEDPYSGKPLVYRREADKYVLYTVGPDGQDDGGKPWDEMNWSGDFLLDEPPQAP
jgi:hypothetical protein